MQSATGAAWDIDRVEVGREVLVGLRVFPGDGGGGVGVCA
jgi:hypothetical protein